MDRPEYAKALDALQGAYDACFDNPNRDSVLGVSHGPFSGVNVALGIVSELERKNGLLRDALKEAQRRLDRKPRGRFCELEDG